MSDAAMEHIHTQTRSYVWARLRGGSDIEEEPIFSHFTRTFTKSLTVNKLTKDTDNDVGLRLPSHVRKVVNLTGVDAGIWWLHVADYYRGIFSLGRRRGRLDPALVRFGNNVLPWLVEIDLETRSNKLDHLPKKHHLENKPAKWQQINR